MAWTFFSPNAKRKRYEEQLTSGKDHTGKVLSESDQAYRKGYARAVKESNRLFALKNSTPESRAAWKQTYKTIKKTKK